MWESWGLADWETKDSKSLTVKSFRGCEGGGNSPSHRRVHWKVGLLWREWHCSLSGPSPIYSTTMQRFGLPNPANTKGSTPFHRTGTPRQTNMAQMKEQIKAPEKELSDEEIDNLRCRVQNTGNQDAHRIGWVWSQNGGKSEGYEKWNKGKCTGN